MNLKWAIFVYRIISTKWNSYYILVYHRNNEDFVKIKAFYQIKVDGERSDIEIELRPCTEEDFE